MLHARTPPRTFLGGHAQASRTGTRSVLVPAHCLPKILTDAQVENNIRKHP